MSRCTALQNSLQAVPDPLLRQSLTCLLGHLHPEWGDRVPLDVFNRLLAKNLQIPGSDKTTHTNVRLNQISSRRERWPTAKLAELRRGHTDPSGIDVECPIVLADYAGELRVLDGNHRINRWVITCDTGLHDVNIHTVIGEARLVDHPPDEIGT